MKFEYRWQVMLMVLSMQALIIGVGIYSFTFFVAAWMQSLSVPRSELMIGYTGSALVSAILAPVSGLLIDRFPVRRLVIIGIAVFCLALLIASQANSALALVIIFSLLIPVGLGLAGPLMSQTLVAQAFTEKRGTALGICALGTSIGGFLMPLIVTRLLSSFDWPQVFVILSGGVAAILIPMAWVILKPETSHRASSKRSEKSMPTAQLLKDPSVYFLAMAAFVPSTLFVAVLQNIGPIATDLAITQQQAGVIVSITALLMAGGKFTTGFLADRVPYGVVYFSLLIMIAIAMFLTATATSYWPLALAVFILGATAGGSAPLVSAVAAARFGTENFGRVMGIVLAFSSLSGLAPLMAGWMRDVSGTYQTAFLLLTPLLLVAALGFWLLLRRPAVTNVN